MAELHFPAAVIPPGTYFPHSPGLFWAICSHNRLQINREARPVAERSGTLAAVVEGWFAPRTFSVK